MADPRSTQPDTSKAPDPGTDQNTQGPNPQPPQQDDLFGGFPDMARAFTPSPASTVPVGISSVYPVARVRVDTTAPHLDRTFDYLVPEELSEDAVPGARVRVQFSERQLTGFIQERTDATDYTRRLLPILTVLSKAPIIAPEIFSLANALADRYAATVTNVLRLAIPPRIASLDKKYTPHLPGFSDFISPIAEVADPTSIPPGTRANNEDSETAAKAPPHDVERSAAGGAELLEAIGPFLTGQATAPFRLTPLRACNTDGFMPYSNGDKFIRGIAGGEASRAVMTVLPSHPQYDWADLLATALVACAAGGRGAIAVVPDAKSLTRLERALELRAPKDSYVVLSSGVKPHARYSAYLRVRLGLVPIVIGTRAAAYAPVAHLGLVACWDDGDASLVERRNPYCHARDVLLLRAQASAAGALFAGYALSSETARLVATGWAVPLSAPRQTVREFSPRVHSTGAEYQLARDPLAATARIPHLAFVQARQALTRGPVLVQVARSGYMPSLSCDRCRMPARCDTCRGPLGITAGTGVPACTWCGHLAQPWRCLECGFTRWRAGMVGALRTAEELGRAFPNVPVISSSGDHVRDGVGSEPSLVVATPGAEPVAEGGYAAALLLDADAMLRFDSLRAEETALRRWFNAAALVRPAAAGGTVVTTASHSAAQQALVRWDPAGFARYEMAERAQLGLPPAVRTAAITGREADVRAFLEALDLPEQVRVTGPVPLADDPAGEEDYSGRGAWRALLFFGYPIAGRVTRELRAVRAAQAALGRTGYVQVRCDGLDVL